ncbi:MAG: haloacid dehalogenase-like hydrolase [Patescibacteria group bacterium]|nr:haloacid dehalogenase-like hydrolase [Patescibacteria group bacterium]
MGKTGSYKNFETLRPELLERKITDFRNMGLGKIVVVADFDGTLSVAAGPNRKYMTTFGTAKLHLGPEHEARSVELYDYYHQFEYASDIPDRERMKKMRSWCQRSMSLIVEYGFSRKTIKRIVEERNIIPRKGLSQFFANLERYNVPTWLVSAGLGDIIQEFILSYSKASNIRIHSNFFDFNGIGLSTGFDKDRNVFIHNKHKSLKQEDRYIKDTSSRPLLVVLGDSVDDLEVIQDRKNCISIGFLEDDIEMRRNEFLENFDLVLQGRQSFSPVLDLLARFLS